ncbi:hypothetical protein AX16_001994 [Volvariella volvacea WC 439]|nr:hypothetical protein AX16_001994 [Volvariella volvacea WC 439]
MVRHEIKQGPIKVGYGHDELTGYFLSVFDNRLEWEEENSAAVNAIAEKVDPEGSGIYFDLHTGQIGFGHKVDIDTLVHFWKAYGVPDGHIQKAKHRQGL